ncbi:heme biosynthesis protein HemY [Thalassovita mediterranea]|jgi:HemY protein|uniref:Tetratricopeptide repeat protein n=1 Tax=Thalassovita mediterranea TaxID=340021 RepID=A0A0P1GS99_9RHOB|nr:heme biosynthesis HemY N-terminal domain-containing protein [Thalassovita mediterranea]CUH85428.1 tetratricopeptide repeat protein [Thalassovita mediterranea]SIS31665.1 HemY protein [Thalassovita mediterranea]
MLWSLTKIVVFVLFVAAVTLGADYLMQIDGGVRIAFAGVEMTLTPLGTAIGLVVLVTALWVLLKLASLTVAVLKFINGDETALSRYFDRNRERKGYQALTDGMMALASGEPRAAMRQASKAEKFLRRPELTNLLTAQAAEMAGDSKKAEEVYKRLLKDDSTRFVGVRGIMNQKLAAGEEEVARQLAEKAIALRPKHVGVQDTLLDLQTRAQDWSGARNTLTLKLKQGTLPRDVHKRRDAVLALSEAKAILAEGQDATALEAAVEANRQSPDLVPAAALAARNMIEKGQARKAAKLIKKTWAAQPHPDLAAAFAAIAPEEDPAARLKRFQPLLRLMPDHRESRLVLAELNIAAEDFPAARKALGDLVDSDPDSRVLTVMAAVERGEGASDTVVKARLTQALSAPRGPQWVCGNCHNIHSDWAPVCGNCQAFDTLSWQVPPAGTEGAGDSVTGVDMLPLIVGAVEDQSDVSEELPEAEIIPLTTDDAEVVEAEVSDEAVPDEAPQKMAANEGSK